MPAATGTAPTPSEPRRLIRVLVLLAGILIPQIILLGPSLVGQKLLLPLDILADRTTYLPRSSPDKSTEIPKDGTYGDLVFQIEVHRRLIIDEVHAGRLPLWNPYNYCGHPLLAANTTQVFSPFRLLDYFWPSPYVLAWDALLQRLVLGIGTYLLLRRTVGLGWLAAAFGGWCASIATPIVMASGFPGASIMALLPWLLLMADRCVQRPSGWSMAGLAGVTALSLYSGHPAFAAHALLAAGLLFVWRFVGAIRQAKTSAQQSGRGLTGAGPLLAAGGGVLLGFLLTAPQTLPTLDYMRSSQRISQREAGHIETPGIGTPAFMQIILPYWLGSTQRGSLYLGVEDVPSGNRIESAALGSAGVLVALVLMPIGWADPNRRRWMIFWTLLALFAAVPVVGVPAIGAIFELPPLSLLRNNRFVFVSGFAVLVMAAIGLNVVAAERHLLARWPARAAIIAGGFAALALAIWCAGRAADVPVDDGGSGAQLNPLILLVPDLWPAATGDDIVSWFGMMYRNAMLLAVIAVVLCLVLLYCSQKSVLFARSDKAQAQHPGNALRVAVGMTALPLFVAVLAAGELVATSFGVAIQSDPALYYPRLAWMDVVASSHSRMCGVDTLPANVALAHRLRDIRGYDGADPMPISALVATAQDPTHEPILSLPYAITLYLSVNPQSPSPVANLLGVRYLVGRGPPPTGAKVIYAANDYWVVENEKALDRVTLPRSVEVVADGDERLRRLSAPTADPAAVTLLEADVPGITAASGNVRLVEDLPGRVVIDADLTQGGIVRLADAWDAGWQATYNGAPVEILRVDHALRGVVVPAGKGTIAFNYAPPSFRRGIWVATAAMLTMVAVMVLWRPRRGRQTPGHAL